MATHGKIISRKNVTLITCESDGITSYKLLDSQGVVSAFSVYANTLADHPFNTRKTYCHAVADFFDYFYEAGFHLALAEEGKTGITKSELRKVIESWSDYLTDGEDSGKDFIRRICTTLPSPRVLKSTSALKNAALTSFLLLSDDVREETTELISIKLMASPVKIDPEPLFNTIHKVLRIGLHESRAIIENSMLAGVITGGPRLKKKSQRQTKAIAKMFDMDRVFPIELIPLFIENLPSYRDKALYSLYAASGCRSHEGLQILWSDIDINARTVRLVNPHFRWNDPSYRALNAKERDKLAWKGRETDVAFLIEPYASMFFEHLEEYMRKEYYPHGQHQFVFQSRRGVHSGTPYFLTAQQTRQQVFNKTAEKIGLAPEIEGVHSFRHAYGTYLLNYMPLEDGKFGLPMGIVRVIMGHASIKSTEKYAVHDKDMIKAQLGYANEMIFKGGIPKTFLDQKIEVLRSELVKHERFLHNGKIVTIDDTEAV